MLVYTFVNAPAVKPFISQRLPRLQAAPKHREKNCPKPRACLPPPVDKELSHAADKRAASSSKPGEVYLVGTGPGDPGLLTLRAVELLSKAEVVLFDRLVSDEILSYINPSAEKVCVGKGRSIGTGSQASIQEQLAYHASLGKQVVRLKGGDPAVFGRLGDEVNYLREEGGIEVGVVPGLTAASGAASSLGFPLTHGGVSEEVRLITGHSGREKQFEIAQVTEGSTIVVYMGLRELGAMLERLRDRGARRDLPAVAVQAATTVSQRTVWGTVDNLVGRVEQAELESPTLIIIGEVVRMARDWREG